MSDSESMARLVPMRIAGEFGKGGLRLAVAGDSAREAWESSITQEEADYLLHLVYSDQGPDEVVWHPLALKVADKLRALASEEEA